MPLAVDPFLTALRQAAIMADDESRKVNLQLENQKLTLLALGADTGRSRVELPINFDGKTTEIAFDPRLLTDKLRVLPQENTITRMITDAKAPATLRCGGDYTYVVMPLA